MFTVEQNEILKNGTIGSSWTVAECETIEEAEKEAETFYKSLSSSEIKSNRVAIYDSEMELVKVVGE